MSDVFRKFLDIDWILFFSAAFITVAGLMTMGSFGVTGDYFSRQVIWFIVSAIVFFILSIFDYRFLKRTGVVIIVFTLSVMSLFALFVIGHTAKGAESWFQIGGVSFQPADFIKLIIIILLANIFPRDTLKLPIFVTSLFLVLMFLLFLP